MREASRTPPRARRAAPGRGTRASPRREVLRRARTGRRSLEDLRRAIAALEPHLMGARGTAGAVVEVDEEVRVDFHPALGRAVHAHEPRADPRIELVVPGRVER